MPSLQILLDYFNKLKQSVQVGLLTLEERKTASWEPHDWLLGSLIFCIFTNDLPDVLQFSKPSIIADDLKFLSFKNSYADTQYHVNEMKNMVKRNGF